MEFVMTFLGSLKFLFSSAVVLSVLWVAPAWAMDDGSDGKRSSSLHARHMDRKENTDEIFIPSDDTIITPNAPHTITGFFQNLQTLIFSATSEPFAKPFPNIQTLNLSAHSELSANETPYLR